MPIYEYRCEECGHTLEKLQRMSEAPLKECPACGEARLRRLISAAGFRLKGGGWYETDFKQGNKRNVLDGGGDRTEAGRSGEDKPAESSKKEDKPASGSGASTTESGASQAKQPA